MDGSSPPTGALDTDAGRPRAYPDPAGDGPERDGTPASSAPAPSGGRTPLARRHDDPQRIEGAGRWSVDATRRRCARCGGELVDGRPFHSVLVPAEAAEIAEGEGDLFVRRDFCADCFVEEPPPVAFAHWRSVLPPAPGGERKVVNLASLLAHFHSLVETLPPPAGAEGSTRATGASDLEADLDPGGEPPLASADPETLAPLPVRRRIAYLLALFLVRRRLLRWEGVDGGVLRLTCRESDRPLLLAVPELPAEELAAAVEEFEGLFR